MGATHLHPVGEGAVVAGVHRGRPGRRLVPLAVGTAGLGAGVVVASFDPSAPGSRFPPCAFHQLTGWWCPGCGLTRGTHELLRGEVLGALGHNLFTPIVLLAAVAAWVVWLRWSWGRPVRHPLRRLPRWVPVTMMTVVAAYGVARNLPIAPFDALAP